jgi:N-acyl-D-amino-acid deacylase
MTVLRGATIVDGTGATRYAADVVIEGDRITAVVEPGAGRGGEVVDLDGLVLTPGFIDCHTHYDAQVLWDPDLTPSSWHGVTTVVMGNCGFGIAPTTPAGRETIARTLENVEGMSVEALTAGIPWTFESFPEYLDAVEATEPRLNVAVMLGHSPLRLFVLGDEASDRAATEPELARMRELVGEALDAGAVGFASSRAPVHAGAWGKPVPSRLAEQRELLALVDVLREHDKGTVEITMGPDFAAQEMAELASSSGRPLTWTAIVARPGAMGILEKATASGAPVYPQVACRPIVFQIQLADPGPLAAAPAMAEILTVAHDERAQYFRDPAWRARARADFDRLWPDRWKKTTVQETRSFPELANGPSLAELGVQRGEHPLDVMCDIALADDLTTRFRVVIANDDEVELAGLLRDERTLLGLSDAGAHASQICDAVFSTYLLEHWVRDTGTLTLEQAIWRLSGQPAAVFGLPGRGRIAPGCFADLVAFDPERIGVEEMHRVWDLPAGADRLIATSRGIERVWVNGVLSRSGSEDLPVRSGRLIRDGGQINTDEINTDETRASMAR